MFKITVTSPGKEVPVVVRNFSMLNKLVIAAIAELARGRKGITSLTIEKIDDPKYNMEKRRSATRHEG